METACSRLVKPFECHLHERQRVAALGVHDETFGEWRVARAEGERRLAGGDGAGDDVLELGRGRGHEIEGRPRGAQRAQRVAGLEARIGVGAHDHDARGSCPN